KQADPFLPRHFGDDGLHDPMVVPVNCSILWTCARESRAASLRVNNSSRSGMPSHPHSRRARREVEVSECDPNMIVRAEKSWNQRRTDDVAEFSGQWQSFQLSQRLLR
ncbi:MAG: hypothetical protein ACXU9D_24265, partial [Xanthobacteraceae bacterium]